MEYNWTLTTNANATTAAAALQSSWSDHNNHYFPGAGNTPLPGDLLARNPDPNLTVLKLGKRHYLEEATAAPHPPKNGKGYCAGSTPLPRCQVEGCDSVLVAAKEYHRRHKVCEVHAKSPRVVVLGIEQRFCQQCSRFHQLSEFDESKRSCRRRLAGHNLRRRKISHEHHAQAGRHSAHLLNTSECALSLLSSSSPNYNPWMVSDDLPARCSAALRDLIAENRASQRQQLNECSDNAYKTLDLMQDPGSAFGLLSVYGHRSHKEEGEEDCSELWRDMPFGY